MRRRMALRIVPRFPSEPLLCVELRCFTTRQDVNPRHRVSLTKVLIGTPDTNALVTLKDCPLAQYISASLVSIIIALMIVVRH